MPQIDLQCSCGKVKGKTENVDSGVGTRIVCCCDDCQLFMQYLDQEGSALDQYGGTDIFQMPVSKIKVTEGHEQIACVRLSATGLYRWYTSCCNTAIGNTMGAGVPFIGVVHSFMNHAADRDADLGKSRGHIYTNFARKKVPDNQQGSVFLITIRGLSKLILWKLKGLNQPSVFFDEDGDPIAKPNILK